MATKVRARVTATIANAQPHSSAARIIVGDCRAVLQGLAPDSVSCAVTSPPYWGLRDYGVGAQIGRESSPDAYVAELVEVFALVRRALRPDGTLWLNLGDSYAGAPGGYQGKNGQRASRTFTARIDNEKTGPGLKPKDLVGIPWRVAFALQAAGWWLRSDVIWSKPNPMPESVTDRPTKSHEYLFLLAKSEAYFYDQAAIAEPAVEAGRIVKATGKSAKNAKIDTDNGTHHGFTVEDKHVGSTRNKRTVWTVPTSPYPSAHFATFPPALIEPCIKAGSPAGGLVLDPFCGTGTVGAVATGHGRSFVGIEINPAYADLARERIGLFARVESFDSEPRT